MTTIWYKRTQQAVATVLMAPIPSSVLLTATQWRRKRIRSILVDEKRYLRQPLKSVIGNMSSIAHVDYLKL